MHVAQFIHGNRLERLADRLIDDLQANAVGDPMQAHVVVVAHPALGRWLQQRVAARSGIAMNIQFPLPSSFAWSVLRACDAKLPRESAFSRSALVWRIHALLPQLSTRVAFAPVLRYLGGGSDVRRRYDLAVALARAFDEYMVARPQWIRAWKRGASVLDDPDERWQAELWRELVKSTSEPDRASLMRDVLAQLDSLPILPVAVPGKVSVFGAAYLPPLLLEFFLALATRVEMRFYQPNPCLDYWGDVISERELARRRTLWNQHGRRDLSDYFEVGHPLLASWGVLGREYLKAIHATEIVVHDDDAFVAPADGHLLGWLQNGLLLLDPEHAPPPPVQTASSIQIHGCPSRRREIEVLRDQLLRLFETLPELKPHEIVVMSPRLEEYVAYIDAVFGDVDDPLAMPYSIGDVSLRRSHPLLDTFARVLALGESRFGASEILGLLSEASIARRHELDEDALEWVRTWISDSGIRWGLDADFRVEIGAAALSGNSWRFGLDRLLLGYAQGDDEAMPGDVVPAANVEGSAAQALGQLARFVDALRHTRDGLAVARTADAWKHWLNERVDALFDTQTDEAAELAALKKLRETIATFANEAGPWLVDEKLPFDVVRSAIGESLDDPRGSRAGRFGLSFCGMVPMRNVPHRVVCVLGLNAGEFPRRQPPPGFQLMRRHQQPGDRSVREDDRFLFLESLGAARDVLYLSHVDRDVRAGTISPPSPMVEELLGFLRQHYGEDAWKQNESAIIRHHPLHPFAASYFRETEISRSYDARWWSAAQALAGAWQPAQAFVEVEALAQMTPPIDSAEVNQEIELEALLAWLRHPARTYFRHMLPLRPPDHDVFEDTEPFGVDALERFGLVERMLGEAGQRPDLKRVRGEGIFPDGPVGDSKWLEFTERAAALEAATTRLLGERSQAVPQDKRSVDLAPIAASLSGVPRHLFDGERSVLLLRRPGCIRGIDLAELALERELLRAEHGPLRAYAIGFEKNAPDVYELGELVAVEQWLVNLLTAYREGLRRPLALFRDSAEAYAVTYVKTLAGKGKKLPIDAAREVWEREERGERDDPFNALLARHHDDILGADFAALSESIYVPLYQALIEIDP